MTGVVVKLLPDKGYGFVETVTGAEYFFHKTDFEGHWHDLAEDFESRNYRILVEFREAPSQKGPRAANVRRTDWPNKA